MEYTKGEWSVYLGQDAIYILADQKDGGPQTPVARLIDAKVEGNKADAHLIASAPDCHRELTNLVSRIEQGLALGEKLDLEPARQALAKAEGK